MKHRTLTRLLSLSLGILLLLNPLGGLGACAEEI